MATLESSIRLNDQMSNTLLHIISVMDSTISVVDRMNSALAADADISSYEEISRSIEEAREQIQEANSAYLRLSQTVGSTERAIRDNTAEQENFNNTVEQGASASNKLWDTVKKIGGAYAGVKGIEKLTEMSDNLVTAKSRLDMMNDGLQSTDELYTMIYNAAQRARGELDGMTDVVARFGNNAKDAFSSNAEVVAFSELVQKQMTIAGASTAEASNAMLQLSQALGSGVLRGDELNSIFEQAPNLIQGIADYLDVPIGKIREMASEGQLTAGVVKASVFASADKINKQFARMPMTWGQMWQSMKNQATVALEPVLEKINEIFNDERFQTGLDAIMEAFVELGDVALDVLSTIADGAAWVADNWSVIGPIVMTAAVALGIYAGAMAGVKVATMLAKVVQDLFNGALLDCPIFWIITALIAFIGIMGVVTKSVNDAYGLALSFGGMLGGSLMVILAGLGNMVIMIYNIVCECIIIIWNLIVDFVNFFGNVFQNPLRAIIQLFTGVFDAILAIIEAVAGAIGKLFGQDWSSGIAEFRQTMWDAVEDTYGKNEEYLQKIDLHQADLEYIDYDEAFELGYDLGDKMGKTFDYSNDINAALNSDYDGLLTGVGDIAGNTDDIKKGLEITDEELKYLRDIAEQETVNRFTTADITINQTNNNSISSEMDLDGIVSGLTDMAAEAVEIIPEGVHA